MNAKELLSDLEKYQTLSNEEAQVLIDEGYNPSEFVSEVAMLLDRLNRKAKMKRAILNLTTDEKSAVQNLAHALNDDDRDAYKPACELAVIKLLGLNGYSHKDPKVILDLLQPFNLA